MEFEGIDEWVPPLRTSLASWKVMLRHAVDPGKGE
jgi:hypothetical protein